jgi:hypothetical protein
MFIWWKLRSRRQIKTNKVMDINGAQGQPETRGGGKANRVSPRGKKGKKKKTNRVAVVANKKAKADSSVVNATLDEPSIVVDTTQDKPFDVAEVTAFVGPGNSSRKGCLLLEDIENGAQEQTKQELTDLQSQIAGRSAQRMTQRRGSAGPKLVGLPAISDVAAASGSPKIVQKPAVIPRKRPRMKWSNLTDDEEEYALATPIIKNPTADELPKLPDALNLANVFNDTPSTDAKGSDFTSAQEDVEKKAEESTDFKNQIAAKSAHRITPKVISTSIEAEADDAPVKPGTQQKRATAAPPVLNMAELKAKNQQKRATAAPPVLNTAELDSKRKTQRRKSVAAALPPVLNAAELEARRATEAKTKADDNDMAT